MNALARSLVLVCLLLLALPLAADKRPGVGYTPLPGSQVFHCDTSREVLLARGCTPSTPLNTSIPWSGSNADTDGYVGRYLGGNRNCLGSWICGIGNENEGLRAREELVRMFQAGQLGSAEEWTGEPTRTEIHDFGGPRPDLGSVGAADPLRKQPTEPVGCCRNDFPCPVDEPGRLPGEIWREPVRTPLGGRKGCYLIQVARPPEPPPPPTDPPPPPDPPIAPKPDSCWLIRIVGDMLTLEKVECP